ncbi:hypothetical protein Acr_25g0000330 [Actinidia rufa]|uniref:Chromo domain-containing protein n=1 Tax=Actinidia rufa TaxID=165716 RepID=A0A7J0GYM3_9ERIC|nr:hypothetical protein Acr_25g0000330 [Actinidia rufa]
MGLGILHRSGVENKAADTLSRRAFLLSLLDANVVGFERLKEDYESCPDFRDSYLALSSNPSISLDDYTIREGFLFRATKLCIPRTSVRDFLVWEIHAGDLAGHFGRDKTIEEVERQFYWPTLKRDVAKIVSQCRTCQVAKHRHFDVPTDPFSEPTHEPSIDHPTTSDITPAPLPISPAPKEHIDAILDEQIISTRDGGVQRFLVRWSGRPASDDTWITIDDLQQIDRDLFKYYQSRPVTHTRRSRVFFTLGELVGTPDPNLLLPVFIAADLRRRTQFHYG